MPDSVTIQWIIPYIAYTPEDYIVLYGKEVDELNERSDTISSDDFTAINTLHTVMIVGLLPSTQYYFLIKSTNTYGSVSTEVMSFTTADGGE